jgi:hypothetical protein
LANGLKDLDALQESQNKNKPVLNPLFKLGGSNDKKKETEKAARQNGEMGATADDNLPKCPTALLGARLISIELASLVAGTR